MNPKHTDRKKIAGLLLISSLLIIVPIALMLSILETQVEEDEYSFAPGRLTIHEHRRLESTLPLQGDWEFFPAQLIDSTTYDLSASGVKKTAGIPQNWNNYSTGSTIPGYGYGTYHLHIEGVEAGKTLALFIPTTATANRVFINEKLVFEAGTITTSREGFIPSYKTGLIRFTPDTDEFHLFIQISNFIYARGGLWHEPVLGYEEAVTRYTNNVYEKDFFLLGSLLMMTIIHLSIFMFRKMETEHLLIGILAFTAIIRIVAAGNYLIYHFFLHVPFKVMFVFEYLSLYWIPVIFVLLTSTLFFPRQFPGLIRALVAYGIFMSFLTIVASVRFSSSIVQFGQVNAVAITIIGITISFMALIKGYSEASYILLGGYIATVFALHDMLFYNNFVANHFGELVPFGLFAAVLLQSIIVTMRYTHNRKKLEELSEHLIRIDKIKSDFLVSTSHELRTPLNGILALSDSLLKGGNGQLNTGQKEKLELVCVSARRLTYLVNDILDVTRLENNDLNLDIRALHINGVIRSVVKVFQTLSIPKGIAVDVHLPLNSPYVLADENRVAQILYNLLGNALKYTREGSILVDLKVSRESAEICVKDTGIGIAADTIDRLFEGSLQGKETTGIGSNGIGLIVCKKLIEMQNGTIRVESVEGEGSSFYITLPIAPSIEIKASKERRQIVQRVSAERSAAETSPTEERGCILIVDDELINLKGAEAQLQLEGYHIITAQTGKEALEIVESKSQSLSLVILDLMLPDLSGYEVCSIIREEKTVFELPILMLTAKNRLEDLVEGLQAGANEFLSKPFETAEFISRVHTLVHLKESVAKALHAEWAFLQAQIKPHFLFNALNTIISFCYEDGAVAAQLLNNLAIFLKRSFDFKYLQTEIPVTQEIELVQAFTAIETARYEKDLDIRYDIQDHLQGNVPPLSIQPLVENAIIHGIRKHSGIGHVPIRIFNENEKLHVKVRDDGIGIPRETVIAAFSKKTEGIGLWNINNRLTRLYGSRLKITSSPGKGTEVSFSIPVGGVV